MLRHPDRRRARSAVHASAWVCLVAALAMAGCSNPQSAQSSSPTGTASASASASASSTPSAAPSVTPVLVPGGAAQENLPVFTAVTAAVWASPDQVRGRAYIDALVAAGFDKSAMQVTADESTVGNPAESIQFSVRWGEECLIGQVGPSTGAPVAIVTPALSEGMCLVGATRPIDW